MSKVTDIIADVARIDSIESTADASAPQATTYTKTESDAITDLLAPKANPTFTGTVSGITATMVGAEPADATIVKDTNYVATEESYTTVEKTKLSGIAAGANNYTLPYASSGTKGGVRCYNSGANGYIYTY